MARYQHNKYYQPEYNKYNPYDDEAPRKLSRHKKYNKKGKVVWHGGAEEMDFDYYFLPEKLAEHPERLDMIVNYYKEKGLFDIIDEQDFKDIMTNYGATGSRMHYLKQLLDKEGTDSYERNTWVQSLAHEVTRTEKSVTALLEKQAGIAERKDIRDKAWIDEETKRIQSWIDAGYTVDYDNYTATKDGVTVKIPATTTNRQGNSGYAPGYQTAAATAANSDKVYIDGKEYNSISEASRETGLSRNTIANGLDDGKTHKGHIITSDGPTSQTYWATREFVNQRRADRNILTADEKVQAVLKDTYVKCAKELNAFYDKLQDGYVPTKSELLRMEEYQVMCANMIEHFDAAALSEAEIVKDCLIDTSGFVLSGYSKEQVEAFAFTEFNGINYSQRIWNNTEVLEEKVKAAVGEAIITGKSYKEAARDLAELTTQGRNATERLIRTETARVYVKAEQQEYKDAGIEYVEVLVEPGACDECAALKGKKWKLYDAPELPVHPNCRCDLLPVI